MSMPRAKLAFVTLLAALFPTPADAVPIAGVVLTVDQTFCYSPEQCGYVTAEMVRSYGTGGPDQTRGVFECTAVVPTSTKVTISCTYDGVTATALTGLPVAATAVGTVAGAGGSSAQLCMDVTHEHGVLFPIVLDYNECFTVFNIGN